MKFLRRVLLYLIVMITFLSYQPITDAQAKSFNMDFQHSFEANDSAGILTDINPSAIIQDPQQEPTPTETEVPPTSTPTATHEPTATATSTPKPTSSAWRPVIVLTSYETKPALVTAGKDFVLEIKIVNQGQLTAHNIILTVTAGNFVPQESGGVLSVSKLEPGDKKTLKQPLSASSELIGSNFAPLEVKVTYTDPVGTLFSEVFNIALNLNKSASSGSTGPTSTPTAVTAFRPQLVITNYHSDVDTLQAGTQFNLQIQVVNNGNADAKRVSMIAGGATISPNENNEGTSTPGNIVASSGEFNNFSPVGVSNVQTLGDIPVGSSANATQPLIVNVTTNPGAYTFKISFAYSDEKGNSLIDDQVISLLVYAIPVVEINFYRDPGPLFAGQPNQLPLQITNLGRKSIVLGSLNVSAEGAQIENNTVLVGALEAGGYFTLDANLIPDQSGPLDLQVTVDYTDDFNQHQTINETIPVEIQEAMIMEPEPYPFPDSPMEAQPETFWQKVIRFFSGLIGLDSSSPGVEPGIETPPVEPVSPAVPPINGSVG